MILPAFDPIAVSLGPLAIHWYGLAWGVGMILAHTGMVREAHRVGWAPKKLDSTVFAGLLGVVIGGRVGYMLFYQWGQFLAAPWSVFAVWEGGMSFHGGLLGGVLAPWFYCWRHGIPVKALLRALDLAVLWIPIALFLVRCANFINGELWGLPTDSTHWFAVVFANDPQQLYRHPSQLYEACLEGLLLFVTMRTIGRYTGALSRAGACSGIALILYGSMRIAVETVREPDAHLGYILGESITQGMILSVPMLVAGGWLLWRSGQRHGS